MDVLRQISGLLFLFATTVGPILGFLLLLNHRDRRQASLQARLLDLTPRDLRDRIAFEVRCPLLSRRSRVAVDMCSCSRDEAWKAIDRWSAHLPPAVRLQVSGRVDQGVPALFTVETGNRRSLCCPPKALPAVR